MTCQDFRELSLTNPLRTTRAERHAAQQHFRGCGDCQLGLLKGMWQAKLNETPEKRAMLDKLYPIADAIRASDRAAKDPEANFEEAAS